MKNILKFTLSATLALTGYANAASIITGTVIGVDFGTFNDVNNFNNVSADVTDIAIIDTSGDTLTGVTFTTSGILASNGQADPAKPGQPSQFTDLNKTDWVLSDTGVTLSMTFTGLNDSLTYNLVIGAANGSAQNVDTTFTADGSSLTNAADVGSTAYVSFNGLSTDGSGNLVITATNAATSDRFAAIAALELTAVPEPSTTALLGLGGLALILRRRK